MRRSLSFLQLLPWLITTSLLGCGPAEMETEAETDPVVTAARQQPEVISSTMEDMYCDPKKRNIRYDRELVITDVTTLSDPCRTRGVGCMKAGQALKWNFMYLMRQAAGGSGLTELQVSDFILNWLYSYVDSPVVNGQKLENRSGFLTEIINPWRTRSGCSTDRTKSCELKPEYAPLRLQSILNRMDARKGNVAYYGDGLAGEGRMIFAFVNAAGMTQKASLILEYNLPAIDRLDVDRWATRWHSLGALDPMMASYGDKLQEITDLFAGSGVDRSSSVNKGSALVRLRSSEIAFADPAVSPKFHEFREFQLRCKASDAACLLSRTGMQLMPVPTAQTPHIDYQSDMKKQKELLEFVNKNTSAVLAETHMVPEKFLAGASQILPGAFAFQWYFVPTNKQTRRLFALSTCNGCHFKETQANVAVPPTGFMVNPTNGMLDKFMTDKITVDVPFEIKAYYNEKQRRECEFQYLLEQPGKPPLTNGSGRPH